MILRIHPENPSDRQIEKAVEVMKNGGIVIMPTDTVYAIACDIYSPKAAQKVAQIKGVELSKADFSFICNDLSSLSEYTKLVSTSVFKLMKRNLPGPFTFILNASSSVPRIFQSRKKTIGIRIPNNPISRLLSERLGNAIMVTSIHDDNPVQEYTTDPELIWERYQTVADAMIDGGFGDNHVSTVVDCTTDSIEILRQGLGDLIL